MFFNDVDLNEIYAWCKHQIIVEQPFEAIIPRISLKLGRTIGKVISTRQHFCPCSYRNPRKILEEISEKKHGGTPIAISERIPAEMPVGFAVQISGEIAAENLRGIHERVAKRI